MSGRRGLESLEQKKGSNIMENTQIATIEQGNNILNFDPSLFQETLTRLETFKAIIMKTFKTDYHYGIIPGCKKPSLLLPGAELICRGFKLLDTYTIENKIEDFEKGFFYYQGKCILTIAGTDIKVTEGMGSCNSRINTLTDGHRKIIYLHISTKKYLLKGRINGEK
jgi:hypothetical protein